MSRKDLVCLCVMIVGVTLFFYGSNYYSAVVGWSGVYLIFVGFFVEIILKVYESMWKRGD